MEITSSTCGKFCKLRIPVLTQMTLWAWQYLVAKIIKINIYIALILNAGYYSKCDTSIISFYCHYNTLIYVLLSFIILNYYICLSS